MARAAPRDENCEKSGLTRISQPFLQQALENRGTPCLDVCMIKTQVHEWHESRPREDGGGKRYTRARWDTRQWHFSVLEPEFDDWQNIEQPGRPEFEALRDVLWRKYQRKRLPFRFLENVDAILAELPPAPDSGDVLED
jgi:hypothetical protein